MLTSSWIADKYSTSQVQGGSGFFCRFSPFPIGFSVEQTGNHRALFVTAKSPPKKQALHSRWGSHRPLEGHNPLRSVIHFHGRQWPAQETGRKCMGLFFRHSNIRDTITGHATDNRENIPVICGCGSELNDGRTWALSPGETNRTEQRNKNHEYPHTVRLFCAALVDCTLKRSSKDSRWASGHPIRPTSDTEHKLRGSRERGKLEYMQVEHGYIPGCLDPRWIRALAFAAEDLYPHPHLTKTAGRGIELNTSVIKRKEHSIIMIIALQRTTLARQALTSFRSSTHKSRFIRLAPSLTRSFNGSNLLQGLSWPIPSWGLLLKYKEGARGGLLSFVFLWNFQPFFKSTSFKLSEEVVSKQNTYRLTDIKLALQPLRAESWAKRQLLILVLKSSIIGVGFPCFWGKDWTMSGWQSALKSLTLRYYSTPLGHDPSAAFHGCQLYGRAPGAPKNGLQKAICSIDCGLNSQKRFPSNVSENMLLCKKRIFSRCWIMQSIPTSMSKRDAFLPPRDATRQERSITLPAWDRGFR